MQEILFCIVASVFVPSTSSLIRSGVCSYYTRMGVPSRHFKYLEIIMFYVTVVTNYEFARIIVNSIGIFSPL